MKLGVNRLKRTAFYGISILVAILVLYPLLSCFFYPPQYVLRALTWGESGVYDYQKLPARPMSASSKAFFFAEDLEEDRVRSLFELNPEISDFDAFLADAGTQAFIVIKDDCILYEHYFQETRRDSIVTSFSVAKSFTSALIGRALEDGYIHSVHDPITKYLPELEARDARFDQITIRDLLMMSSGIRYSEEIPLLNDDGTKTYLYPDMRQLALEETRIAERPGEHFLYNNYNPLLLGLILERSTGRSVTAYLEQRIWKPLGMEFDGSWSLDGEASGFEKMESGINARAIDFAKLGRLFLHRGNWEGRQLIPASWVSESTQEDPGVDREDYYRDFGLHETMDGYYKYMWWGLPRPGDEYDYAALGAYGQFIYVSPQKDLIIVRNGEKYGIDDHDWLRVFYDFASAF